MNRYASGLVGLPMAPIDDVCKMGKFELVPSSADITMLNEIIIYEWPLGWDAGARWLSVGGGRMNSSSGAAASPLWDSSGPVP